jgi:hypothetical protein
MLQPTILRKTDLRIVSAKRPLIKFTKGKKDT